MHHSNPNNQPPLCGAALRACLLTSSLLLAAGNAMAQGAALEAIDNNEAKQREAAAQNRANQAASGQRDAAKHFSSVAPGVVKDSRTGLEWMRCSVGQDWSEKSKTCTGSVRTYTWQGALDIANKLNSVGGYAGRTNWRVPTVRELQSLRYCSNGFVSETIGLPDGASVPQYCADGSTRPTIAKTVFPNMDSDKYYYWTSTPYAGDSSSAWFVYFSLGNISSYYVRVNYGAVRLVR